MSSETAYLAGGCFWCLEAVYQDLGGVRSVKSGYMGGDLKNPTYEQVCSGRTGHAETVRVVFDPEEISYADILGVFFSIHDPTQLNRQGNDIGTQYRSAIFYEGADQKEKATAALQRANDAYDGDVVTELSPATTFYPAEEEHDNYFARNPYQPYCMAVVSPKVNKFRQQYAGLLKARG